MKAIVIKIILAVANYQVHVTELQTHLSVIAPVKIEVIDLANEQDASDLYKLHYALVSAKVKRDPVIFLHAQFKGGLSGGKASHGIANVAIVPGYDERNTQVIAHEALHLFGVGHNTDPCNLMNVQPCGFEIRAKDILKAKKARMRK